MAIPLNSTIIQQAGGAVLTTTAPSPLGASNVTGVATTAARADHVHAHGQQGGGAQHSAATASANGFMSAADKAKLDAASTANVASTLVMRTATRQITSEFFTAGAGGSLSGGYNVSGRWLGASGAIWGSNVAMTAPAFTPTSDIRLKTAFANVLDQDALVRLLQIEPLEYTRLQDDQRARGFGAQGLRDIDPLYVVGDEPVFDEETHEDEAGEIVIIRTPRLDETGEQMRTPLGVDPVAILADVVAAIRAHEVRLGLLEIQTASAANPA